MGGRTGDVPAEDPFAEPSGLGAEAARAWVAALNRRAGAPDQFRIRAELLRHLHVCAGQAVLEVGSGTGVLLGDLALAVGPDGPAVGIEPQEAFAAEARRRLAAAGAGGRARVVVGPIEDAPLRGGTFDAAVAQTVLIHLAEGRREAALDRMRRAVRAGGWVASADQDADTWVVDHPDRDLARRIVRFTCERRHADGWTGRSLPRWFRAVGLREVRAAAIAHVDTESGSHLHGLAERVARAAAAAGAVTQEEADGWIEALGQRAEAGEFVASINFYVCSACRQEARRRVRARSGRDA